MEKIKDNEWTCVHLVKSGEKKYMRQTGRVSSRVDPSAYYTGDGIVYENRILECYSLASPETYTIGGI